MPIVLLLLALPWQSCAALVNVTVDDTYGDERSGLRPSYEPANTWRPSPLLSSEAGGPDLSYTYDVTLREYVGSDGNGTISLEFSGTSISVFVVALTVEFGALSPGPFTFFLDNDAEPAGQYVNPPGHRAHLYRQPAFHSVPLPLSNHSLRMVLPPLGSVYFDYAIYTTDDAVFPAPITSSRKINLPSRPIVVGASPPATSTAVGNRSDEKMRWEAHVASAQPARLPDVDVMAELVRVRTENARTRAEIAVLRRAVELPPQYSDGERSERGRDAL
ncbi:hypothetical protein AURDEDRAFT_123994 [Auricularia subglabra TFB-10046 SS5]|nr:hypothetical protein AURDEDRAFT_123994 [Auricularia subglabra TFB-10046 SS5]